MTIKETWNGMRWSIDKGWSIGMIDAVMIDAGMIDVGMIDLGMIDLGMI